MVAGGDAANLLVLFSCLDGDADGVEAFTSSKGLTFSALRGEPDWSVGWRLQNLDAMPEAKRAQMMEDARPFSELFSSGRSSTYSLVVLRSRF